jgi:hypothetical protein
VISVASTQIQNVKQRISAARCARALGHIPPPHKTEGAGKTGCALHPRSRVQSAQRKAHTSIQVQRKHSIWEDVKHRVPVSNRLPHVGKTATSTKPARNAPVDTSNKP